MADSIDFELSSDDMRTLGYRVVDMIVDHHSALPGKSATGLARRDQLEALLREAAAAGLTLRELDERYTDAMFEITGGNKLRAAKLLGIDRKTLYAKIKRHGLAP